MVKGVTMMATQGHDHMMPTVAIDNWIVRVCTISLRQKFFAGQQTTF
jgi:hypothetical protein